MEEAVATFDVYSGADFGTISRRSVITCHVYSKELVGPIDVNKQIQIKKLTCTSFSPRDTLLTISIRAALSGFGFRLYSASSVA